MSLDRAVAEVLLHSSPAPTSEAATCHRIIYPLLLAAGYTPLEIEPESTASPGQRPDYTILPGTNAEWYVEAKAWTVALEEDRYLQQALDYANRHVRRWVVLTNGKHWRLYDNDLRGPSVRSAANKLVAEACLHDTDGIQRFLTAVGKQSVASGDLERFASRSRLQAVMAAQLGDENSDTLRAVWQVIRREPGLASVSRKNLADYFQASIDGLRRPSRDPSSSPQVRAETLGEDITLDVLLSQTADRSTGMTPDFVVFPDSTRAELQTWRDLACAVVTWLGQSRPLPPMPFWGGRGDLYFLNLAPEHKTGPMKASAATKRVRWGERDIYMDTHRSAHNLLRHLCAICDAVGVAPSEIRVGVRNKQES